MSAKTIEIRSVARVTASGETDALTLAAGVNVIVGVKDTGKSSWLQTISYLLGDTDPPEKALGFLAAKFDSASLVLLVGDEEITLQRRWKEHGARGKIFINAEPVRDADFSEFIFTKLGVPTVRFPKGNPYSGATWPLLSWRMLFRHIYREERFWSDLADKQPERDQHACILQFLGVAEKLYPAELGDEIDKRKELLRLQARKDQFNDVLQEAAKDLVPDPAIATAPTIDSIDGALETLRNEGAIARARREDLVRGVSKTLPSPMQTDLGERRARLAQERESAHSQFLRLMDRHRELAEYRASVQKEAGRLRRAEMASEIFKPLHVTRCPHCDQRVSPASARPGECFVCHQPISDSGSSAGVQQRVAFEVEQLEGEDGELADLVERLSAESHATAAAIKRLDAEIAEVDALLQPIRSAAASILPPEIAVLDTEAGRREERIAQLIRLRAALAQRDALSREIDGLAAKVAALSGQLEAESEIPYAQLSDVLSDGINEYLNELKRGDPARWQHDPIRFELRERAFRLRLGKTPWTSLGATSIGQVALGYHYALLKLSGQDSYRYPGIALIDFPMTLADKTSVADKENYLIEPFVRLAERQRIQIVVAGRSFEGLTDAHRIELTQVWAQGKHDPDDGRGPTDANR